MLLNSQIEGTQCSLEDVLSSGAEGKQNKHDDIEEVSNYVKTMNEGLKRLSELPVCTHLIKEIHSTLISGVRGAHKTSGEFRQSQHWMGRSDVNLDTAELIPTVSS